MLPHSFPLDKLQFATRTIPFVKFALMSVNIAFLWELSVAKRADIRFAVSILFPVIVVRVSFQIVLLYELQIAMRTVESVWPFPMHRHRSFIVELVMAQTTLGPK